MRVFEVKRYLSPGLLSLPPRREENFINLPARRYRASVALFIVLHLYASPRCVTRRNIDEVAVHHRAAL